MRRVPKRFDLVALGSTLELHTAAETGDVAIVQDMLHAGAEIDHRDKFGNASLYPCLPAMRRVPRYFDLVALELSPELHTTVETGDVAIVQDVLHAGAEIDHQDEFGNTPLHIASWRGDRLTVEVLLLDGAQADVRRTDGKTPLDLAELRLSDAGGTLPDGLSNKGLHGEWRGITALLREATPEAETIAAAQETLAHPLSMSQTGLRSVPLCAHLLTDFGAAPVLELFDCSVKEPSSSEKEQNLALNELSHSSLVTASTCASESDLAHGQMEMLAQTFRLALISLA